MRLLLSHITRPETITSLCWEIDTPIFPVKIGNETVIKLSDIYVKFALQPNRGCNGCYRELKGSP